MTHILLNPTWSCVNKCAYCWLNSTIRKRPELLNAKTRPFDDWLSAVKRELVKIETTTGRTPLVIDIAGGEPFLLPWIVEFIAHFPEVPVGLSTNGLPDHVLQLVRRPKLPNLISINMSYHPGTTERYPDYEQFFRNRVLDILGTGYPLHISAVGYGEGARLVRDLAGWATDIGIDVYVSPYEDMAMLADKQEQGLVCKGGINHIVVAPDGTSWPCLSTLRSPFWRESILGNWLDDNIDISKKEQPCHIYCVDYYFLKHHHRDGDMWGVEAREA